MTELVHNAAIGLSFTLRNFRDDPVVFFGRPELNPLMLEFENNTGDYISAPGATIKLFFDGFLTQDEIARAKITGDGTWDFRVEHDAQSGNYLCLTAGDDGNFPTARRLRFLLTGLRSNFFHEASGRVVAAIEGLPGGFVRRYSAPLFLRTPPPRGPEPMRLSFFVADEKFVETASAGVSNVRDEIVFVIANANPYAPVVDPVENTSNVLSQLKLSIPIGTAPGALSAAGSALTLAPGRAYGPVWTVSPGQADATGTRYEFVLTPADRELLGPGESVEFRLRGAGTGGVPAPAVAFLELSWAGVPGRLDGALAQCVEVRAPVFEIRKFSAVPADSGAGVAPGVPLQLSWDPGCRLSTTQGGQYRLDLGTRLPAGAANFVVVPNFEQELEDANVLRFNITLVARRASDGARDERTLGFDLRTPQIANFAAQDRVIRIGEGTRLNYATQYASQISIAPGPKTLPASGGIDVAPQISTEYILTVEGYGRRQAATHVRVRRHVAFETGVNVRHNSGRRLVAYASGVDGRLPSDVGLRYGMDVRLRLEPALAQGIRIINTRDGGTSNPLAVYLHDPARPAESMWYNLNEADYESYIERHRFDRFTLMHPEHAKFAGPVTAGAPFALRTLDERYLYVNPFKDPFGVVTGRSYGSDSSQHGPFAATYLENGLSAIWRWEQGNLRTTPPGVGPVFLKLQENTDPSRQRYLTSKRIYEEFLNITRPMVYAESRTPDREFQWRIDPLPVNENFELRYITWDATPRDSAGVRYGDIIRLRVYGGYAIKRNTPQYMWQSRYTNDTAAGREHYHLTVARDNEYDDLNLILEKPGAPNSRDLYVEEEPAYFKVRYFDSDGSPAYLSMNADGRPCLLAAQTPGPAETWSFAYA